MVLYVGETITIKATAVNPLLNNAPIDDAEAKVEVYPQGLDPKNNPADRTTVFKASSMAWDPAAEAYIAYLPTKDYEPGKYGYKVTLSGTYESWEYSTFTLKA